MSYKNSFSSYILKKNNTHNALLLVSCVLLLIARYLSTSFSLIHFLVFLLFVIVSYYLSVSNKWYRFIGKTGILICIFYTGLYNGAIVGFRFPLEVIFADVISVMLATNGSEIEAFTKNIIAQRPSGLLFSLASLFSFFLTFFVKRRSSKECGNKSAIFLFVFTTLLFSMLYFEAIGQSASVLTKKLPTYIDQIMASYDASEKRKHFQWNAKATVKGSQVVVLVLGETTRGDHMSICGYERNTTPNLKKMDVIAFKDSISIGSHTLISTPFMLTRKPVTKDNIYKLFDETSIISAFKEAGFKTFYLSYLTAVHVGDNEINQIVSEADVFQSRPWFDDQDSQFIPMVDHIISQDSSPKKLIIIKLLGSHLNFQDTYPLNFDVFKPSFKTEKYTGHDVRKKQVFINTYDNSILHTDFVVSKIIETLQKINNAEVSLSFISDHGTSIFEDDKTLYGGFNKANYNAAMFFWFNDIVYSRLYNKINIMKKNINKPVDSTYFIDTVLDIAGVDSKRNGKNLFDNRLSSADNRYVIVGDDIDLYKNIMY